MKKLLGIIAIALLFSFAGTQEITAQSNWEITVTWEDDCDPCDEITGHEYVVCLNITNTCTSTQVYNSCVEIASGIFTCTFTPTDVCQQPNSLQCYLVTAEVIKRCTVSEEEICSDDDHGTYSCDDIYEGDIVLEVGLY